MENISWWGAFFLGAVTVFGVGLLYLLLYFATHTYLSGKIEEQIHAEYAAKYDQWRRELLHKIQDNHWRQREKPPEVIIAAESDLDKEKENSV